MLNLFTSGRISTGLRLFFLVATLSLVFLTGFSLPFNKIIHEVTIHHPGMKEEKVCQLVQLPGEVSDTAAFWMDVQSVICLDGQCKIVDVRLHWDRTGAYRKYSLAEGVKLEKKDGILFTKFDYAKLQTILKDKQSVFAEFQLAEVVDVNKEDGGIDGISGATVLTDETATVKGASWTCYTLWHWANGAVQDTIRAITVRSAGKQEVKEMLASPQHSLRTLALGIYLDREWYDGENYSSVVTRFPDLNRYETKIAADYLLKAPAEIREQTFFPLLDNAREKQRMVLLQKMIDPALSVETAVPVVDLLPKLRTYPEVNLLVGYISRENLSSPEILQALSLYLDHENFLIARRVYWYLNECDLTPTQKEWVEAFGKQHSDRL